MKLQVRFKIGFIVNLITPFMSILMPIFIMSKFFEYNNRFGSWTVENFLLFQFLACNLYLLIATMRRFQNALLVEKFWNTLPILILGPVNRFNILISILLTRFVIIIIPFTFFFIICCVIYPISFFTILLILAIFFLIAMIFSGIGLSLGILALAKESALRLINIMFSFIFIFSCITYPYAIFPKSAQFVIDLNPFYYIFDFLRLTWVEDNIIISISSHLIHFLVLFLSAVIFPCIGIYIFNRIFKKYGIVGY